LSQARILGVGEVVRYIQGLLEEDSLLQNLWVRGEISNFRSSGAHWYFTLKDAASSLRCVMFRSRAVRVNFLPQNGLQVVVRGYVSVFERDGGLSFYVEELQADGAGALWVAFQNLKARLEAEGLFAPQAKRPLPFFPRVVGIVTSPYGAAFHDLKTIIHRRAPGTRIILAPSAVQGQQAPSEIVSALAQLNAIPEVEVIIVGRGGGSLEELWAFNTEMVARAIRASRVPVISAVGHETDFTIADLAADRRAPTPSAAAEMVVPVQSELMRQVKLQQMRLFKAMQQRLSRCQERLKQVSQRRVLLSPYGFLQLRQQLLDSQQRMLERSMQQRLFLYRQRLGALSRQLDALSPLAVLGRGYAVCRRFPGQEIIFSYQQVEEGQKVEVWLKEGWLLCEVTDRGGRAE